MEQGELTGGKNDQENWASMCKRTDNMIAILDCQRDFTWS